MEAIYMFFGKIDDGNEINVEFDENGKSFLVRKMKMHTDLKSKNKIVSISVKEEISYDDLFKLYKENDFYDDSFIDKQLFDMMDIKSKRAFLEFRKNPIHYQNDDIKHKVDVVTIISEKYASEAVNIIKEISKEYVEKYAEYKSIIESEISIIISYITRTVIEPSTTPNQEISAEAKNILTEINDELIARFEKLINSKIEIEKE
jgi:hypothetical protein